MAEITMGEAEARFADIIWKNEPLPSGELWKKAQSELGWKKSTSFTVLKRLCEKGIFKNESGSVSSVISRESFYAAQSKRFVDETFKGSLPAFLAAFASQKKLSQKEIDEIKEMISSYEEE